MGRDAQTQGFRDRQQRLRGEDGTRASVEQRLSRSLRVIVGTGGRWLVRQRTEDPSRGRIGVWAGSPARIDAVDPPTSGPLRRHPAAGGALGSSLRTCTPASSRSPAVTCPSTRFPLTGG